LSIHPPSPRPLSSAPAWNALAPLDGGLPQAASAVGTPAHHLCHGSSACRGVERFIVNTHHCAAAYAKAFPESRWRGRPILFRYEPVLLNTGGGLKNIEDLLVDDSALWVYNGDILTDLPLQLLLDGHRAGGREVTLALRTTGSPRNVGLDAQGRICDFRFTLGREAALHLPLHGALSRGKALPAQAPGRRQRRRHCRLSSI
jgi:hypothetical protein